MLVQQGIHPAHDRKEVKRRDVEALEEYKRAKESSFAKVSAAYLAEVKSSYTPGSYRSKEGRIRKYLAPKLDALPISEIGVKEIRPILDETAHGYERGPSARPPPGATEARSAEEDRQLIRVK